MDTNAHMKAALSEYSAARSCWAKRRVPCRPARLPQQSGCKPLTSHHLAVHLHVMLHPATCVSFVVHLNIRCQEDHLISLTSRLLNMSHAGNYIYSGFIPLVKMALTIACGFILAKKGMFPLAAARGASYVAMVSTRLASLLVMCRQDHSELNITSICRTYHCLHLYSQRL